MRSSFLCCLLACGVLIAACGVATPARADSVEAKDEAKKDGAHKEEKEKDKTAFLGIKRWDLGIYTLIVFAGLVFVLGKYAWGPIMQGLEKREQGIASHHADAEKAKADAEKLLAEVRAQRAKVHEEVTEILAEARRDADKFRESEKARTAADIQSERDRLKREIETARDQALKEIWEKTVELSTLVSSKAIGRVVSQDDHRRLIDESLGELGQKIAASKA